MNKNFKVKNKINRSKNTHLHQGKTLSICWTKTTSRGSICCSFYSLTSNVFLFGYSSSSIHLHLQRTQFLDPSIPNPPNLSDIFHSVNVSFGVVPKSRLAVPLELADSGFSLELSDFSLAVLGALPRLYRAWITVLSNSMPSGNHYTKCVKPLDPGVVSKAYITPFGSASFYHAPSDGVKGEGPCEDKSVVEH